MVTLGLLPICGIPVNKLFTLRLPFITFSYLCFFNSFIKYQSKGDEEKNCYDYVYNCFHFIILNYFTMTFYLSISSCSLFSSFSLSSKSSSCSPIPQYVSSFYSCIVFYLFYYYDLYVFSLAH